MVLIYKFKKEKLLDGSYKARPRIHILLRGSKTSIEVPALIDTGCDTTVIPEGIAKAIGLDMNGKKNTLYGFKESSDVIQSKIDITFLGRVERESEILNNIPALILLSKDEESKDEEDVVLGIDGIFDFFEVTFKKSVNKIILKKDSRFINSS